MRKRKEKIKKKKPIILLCGSANYGQSTEDKGNTTKSKSILMAKANLLHQILLANGALLEKALENLTDA